MLAFRGYFSIHSAYSLMGFDFGIVMNILKPSSVDIFRLPLKPLTLSEIFLIPKPSLYSRDF